MLKSSIFPKPAEITEIHNTQLYGKSVESDLCVPSRLTLSKNKTYDQEYWKDAVQYWRQNCSCYEARRLPTTRDRTLIVPLAMR